MSNHRAYLLYAHITWHTWQRVGCLDQAAVQDVESAVRSACQKTSVRVLRGAVLADHVHLLVSYRPDSCLSDFIRLAKGVAAHRANLRVPGAVRWARGFYVASVGKEGLARVARYIGAQCERHPDRLPRASRLDRAPIPTTDPGRQPGEH